MTMKYSWVAILLLLFSATVYAQSYQYTDENGVQHITDNLAEVPADHRTGSITIADNSNPKGASAEDLTNTKAVLDQEHDELVKEAEAIDAMAGTPLTQKEFDAYTQKVNQFNARRADYERRLREFQQQVDAFQQQQAIETETFINTEKQKSTTAEGLTRAKAELDQAYSNLMKEREAIASECKDPATTEAYNACKQKVADFNERKSEYDRRAKDYKEKAEAYNQSLK